MSDQGGARSSSSGNSPLTLQYIVEAIVYYNPLKIFLLLSLICAAVSIVLFVVALAF